MFIGLCLLLLFALVMLRVFVVRFNEEKTARVIERMGGFHRVIDAPGIYLHWPFVDRVRMCVSLASFKIEPTPLHLDTFDVSSMLVARVVDPVVFCYERAVALDMVRAKAEELIRTHFQNAESSLFVSQPDTQHASAYIIAELKDVTSAYGVTIERCAIEIVRKPSMVERQIRKSKKTAEKMRAREDSQARTNALLVAKAEAEASAVRKFLDVTQMTPEEYLRFIHIKSGKKVIDELLEKDLLYFHSGAIACAAPVGATSTVTAAAAADAR